MLPTKKLFNAFSESSLYLQVRQRSLTVECMASAKSQRLIIPRPFHHPYTTRDFYTTDRFPRLRKWNQSVSDPISGTDSLTQWFANDTLCAHTQIIAYSHIPEGEVIYAAAKLLFHGVKTKKWWCLDSLLHPTAWRLENFATRSVCSKTLTISFCAASRTNKIFHTTYALAADEIYQWWRLRFTVIFC